MCKGIFRNIIRIIVDFQYNFKSYTILKCWLTDLQWTSVNWTFNKISFLPVDKCMGDVFWRSPACWYDQHNWLQKHIWSFLQLTTIWLAFVLIMISRTIFKLTHLLCKRLFSIRLVQCSLHAVQVIPQTMYSFFRFMPAFFWSFNLGLLSLDVVFVILPT